MEYRLPFKDYNKALKLNKLLGLKCNNCETITCPPMMVCRECASTNHEVIQLSGTGKIVTFTTSYIAAEGREGEVPYTIVMVELDEGPWIMGNLIDIDPAKVGMELIGKRVRLGHKVFPGDKYSAGDAARPLFSFAD
ncbi:MAG: Zn-ribbon domain-containing OB-fold protein [Syntrophomonadaceae bacterium]|nr:Zn-ribbon domain-containing OB-fold protein [Syntrophomonadaceae bacterium]